MLRNNLTPLAIFFMGLFAFLFHSTAGFSQFRPPHFSRLDKSKGTETSFPMDLAVDKDFRYWIATFNGLMEYNGNNFKNYQMPFTQNGVLGSAYLFRMLFENDSILWIAHGTGIAKFNIYSKQFDLVPIPHIRANSALNFIEGYKDSDGKIFFISPQINLIYYDSKMKVMKPFEDVDQSKTGFIYKITESKDKKLYLLHTANGLQLFDKQKKVILTESECPRLYRWTFRKEFKGSLNDFAEIEGIKYISVQDTQSATYSVLKFSESSNEIVKLPIKANRGRLLFVDSFGKLWIYGFGGKDEACLYDPSTNLTYSLPDKNINSSEIDFSLCYKIVEDHEHNIWLCTNTGVLTYNPRQSNYSIISKDLPKNVYSYIEQIDSTHIWFGTLYGGICEYDARHSEFKVYDLSKTAADVAYNDIWQILTNKKGTQVWVLHQEGKISRYDVKQKKFFHYSNAVFEGDDVSLSDDDAGNVFVITTAGKIACYDEGTDKFKMLLDLTQTKGIPKDLVVADIVAVGNKTLVIGTSGHGLIKYDLNSGKYNFIAVDQEDSLSIRSNMINILKRFDEDHIYAGTTNGIFSYNFRTDSIETYNYSNRSNLGFVYQLARDQNKDFIYFIGTSKMYLLNWKTKDIIDIGRRANIERANLTELHYSSNLKKVFVISEESIYEVQVNQSDFDPQIKPILYSLESYDKDFYLQNGGNISLDREINSFRISFGASTYRYKDDLEYYYDFDNSGWIPTLTNEVAFSNLSGGEHVFKLKIVYKGNRNNSHETFVRIYIRKKFHETVWFYVLIGATALLTFYAVYRIRITRLLAVEKIRFQLSRDLHDDMGSTLSTINILSSMAGNKLNTEPQTTQNYLEKISSYSQGMMESMDDIVWSINPGNDNMSKVLNRMRGFANSILEPKGIELIFNSDPEVETLDLKMAIRRDFFLIFKEALNNAAKYANASKIKIEIGIRNKQLFMCIRDNGIGFDQEKVNDGNGLTNMKKRAEKIKGQFKLSSGPGEGTKIELRLNIKHL